LGVVRKRKATPSHVAIKLVTRLRELRKIHRLTQESFAERSGISYKYYQAVEAGRKRDLRLSTLERLAKAYGIELWQLFSPQFPRTQLRKAKRKQKTSLISRKPKTSPAIPRT
jgi:transcriptional regulator with XRE-family HTH domain